MTRQRSLRNDAGKLKASPVLDRFADLLIEEVSPLDAAERMGLARATGQSLLKRLRKRMGAQAI